MSVLHYESQYQIGYNKENPYQNFPNGERQEDDQIEPVCFNWIKELTELKDPIVQQKIKSCPKTDQYVIDNGAPAQKFSNFF